jgi:hypothetical protein
MSLSESGDKSLKHLLFRRNRKEGVSTPEQGPMESGDVGSESRSAVSDVCDGLITVLGVIKEASAAFPPLASAMGGLLGVCNVFKVSIIRRVIAEAWRISTHFLQKMTSNTDDLKGLRKYVDGLNNAVKTSVPGDYQSCPERLRIRLDALSKYIC